MKSSASAGCRRDWTHRPYRDGGGRDRPALCSCAAASKEALQGVGGNPSLAELGGGAAGRREAFDRVAVALRAFTDGLQGCWSCRCRPAPAAHVSGHARSAPPRWPFAAPGSGIRGWACATASSCRMIGSTAVWPCCMCLIVASSADGVEGRELPPGVVLLAGCVLELSDRAAARSPRGPGRRYVSHAAPQGIAHDVSLIGDGLALEAAVLAKLTAS